MSAEPAENLPISGEVDRFEAQRQAFSRLMARFTADRDAMIGAVQQCNERIDSLALRLAGGEVAPSREANDVAGAAVANGAGGMPEVRSLTDRSPAQQAHAVAEVDDEALRLLAERTAAVEEQLRGLEKSVRDLRHAERALPVEDGAISPLVSLGLRDLRDQMANLEGLVAWTPKLQRLWVSLVAAAAATAAAVVYVR